MEEKENSIDWHSGFAGGLEFSFRRYRDVITIEREHLLSKEPLRIDFLLVKKRSGVQIDNAIGRVFRGYNIIEYKSPDDALDIDTIWKVIGYASLLKSLEGTGAKISEDDITITIIRSRKPRALFTELNKKGRIVSKPEAGVYQISGIVDLPLQIIVSDELEDDSLVALKILKKKADEDAIRAFLKEAENYEESVDRQNISAVLNVSWSANNELYEEMEGGTMRDYFKEFVDSEIERVKPEIESEGAEIKLIEQVRKKIARGKNFEEISDDLEEDNSELLRDIYNVAFTADPQETARDIYAKLKNMTIV